MIIFSFIDVTCMFKCTGAVFFALIHFKDRGDGVKGTPDIFYRKIKSAKESLPPIFVSSIRTISMGDVTESPVVDCLTCWIFFCDFEVYWVYPLCM